MNSAFQKFSIDGLVGTNNIIGNPSAVKRSSTLDFLTVNNDSNKGALDLSSNSLTALSSYFSTPAILNLCQRVSSSRSSPSLSSELDEVVQIEAPLTRKIGDYKIEDNLEESSSGSSQAKKLDPKEAVNAKSSPPIRQTLSYFDVIFPHIKMMCSNNVESISSESRKTQPVDECGSERRETDVSPTFDGKSLPEKWIELIQSEFTDFASPAGMDDDPIEFESPSMTGTFNGIDGDENRFFFQQMQKTKRIRTAFSPSQLVQLEKAFKQNHYVIGNERKVLAKQLALSETQVKVWFQNRRTKQKRVESILKHY